MPKFYGKVGYAETEETTPGVWVDRIVDRDYYGDVTRNSRRWEASNTLNDNLVFNNTISIVADAYALQNFSAIKYVVWMGNYWKVTTVEVQAPRLILTFGGVYNGPKAEASDDTGGDSWV